MDMPPSIGKHRTNTGLIVERRYSTQLEKTNSFIALKAHAQDCFEFWKWTWLESAWSWRFQMFYKVEERGRL